MKEYVFPKDNENEFIRIAELLGISELCFVYDKPKDVSSFQKITKIDISIAVLCKPVDVKKFKQKHTTIVRAPDDPSLLRTILEQYRPHIVFGLECQRRSDFVHHRASGLNHVLSQIAVDRDVCIGFSFSDLLSAKPWERQRILGRMKQNLRFAKKFKFKTCFSSFAESPWHLRNQKDIFCLNVL